MQSEVINAPYCSMKLVFNEKTLGDLFYVIFELEILKLKNRIQLGRLTHPVTEEGAHQENGYLWFPFSHSRYDHSILMIPSAVILLTRLGFSQEFIRQFVLIAFSHDIATPINGDASMRLNKELLCEVRNYRRFMIESGVNARWKVRHGFDLDDADDAVNGVGSYAFLVDFFDRWSYTILDVYHLGKRKPEKIANLIRRNRFIADVWQDICATKEHVYFSDARRLHKFLLLRTLMHTEFYYNPACRKLEHLFFCEKKIV